MVYPRLLHRECLTARNEFNSNDGIEDLANEASGKLFPPEDLLNCRLYESKPEPLGKQSADSAILCGKERTEGKTAESQVFFTNTA